MLHGIQQGTVLKNQETIDALHEWLCTFDIRNINGQNVAVGKFRRIIHALDKFGLPANVLRCLSDGFAHADNKSFKNLYVILSTVNRSAIMQTQFSTFDTQAEVL